MCSLSSTATFPPFTQWHRLVDGLAGIPSHSQGRYHSPWQRLLSGVLCLILCCLEICLFTKPLIRLDKGLFTSVDLVTVRPPSTCLARDLKGTFLHAAIETNPQALAQAVVLDAAQGPRGPWPVTWHPVATQRRRRDPHDGDLISRVVPDLR